MPPRHSDHHERPGPDVFRPQPALTRHRWILLPIIALSVVLDAFAILTSVLLGEWLTVGVGVLLIVLLLVAYSTVRDFRP